MKILVVILAVALASGVVTIAQAVPPGLTVEFDGKGEGRVVFSGTTHADEDMHCTSCHMAKFDVSRAAQISWADHRADQFCFTCHNGERAFAARRNCAQCHEEVPEDDAEH
jgi:c(7)-type cytochrome triheme protein